MMRIPSKTSHARRRKRGGKVQKLGQIVVIVQLIHSEANQTQRQQQQVKNKSRKGREGLRRSPPVLGGDAHALAGLEEVAQARSLLQDGRQVDYGGPGCEGGSDGLDQLAEQQPVLEDAAEPRGALFHEVVAALLLLPSHHLAYPHPKSPLSAQELLYLLPLVSGRRRRRPTPFGADGDRGTCGSSTVHHHHHHVVFESTTTTATATATTNNNNKKRKRKRKTVKREGVRESNQHSIGLGWTHHSLTPQATLLVSSSFHWNRPLSPLLPLFKVGDSAEIPTEKVKWVLNIIMGSPRNFQG